MEETVMKELVEHNFEARVYEYYMQSAEEETKELCNKRCPHRSLTCFPCPMAKNIQEQIAVAMASFNALWN